MLVHRREVLLLVLRESSWSQKLFNSFLPEIMIKTLSKQSHLSHNQHRRQSAVTSRRELWLPTNNDNTPNLPLNQQPKIYYYPKIIKRKQPSSKSIDTSLTKKTSRGNRCILIGANLCLNPQLKLLVIRTDIHRKALIGHLSRL